MIVHEVNLHINDLARAVAPCDGPSGELPPRHVVLLPAVLVTARPAPPEVHRVELGSEASA